MHLDDHQTAPDGDQGERWAGTPGQRQVRVHPVRVVIKALLIFAAFNVAYAAINPPVGRLSIYNWLVRGRVRLPFSDTQGHRISVDDIDALFAAHEISGQPKQADEFRVVVLGDSQTWGWSLGPDELVSSYLNAADLSACGKRLRFYDLALPKPSVLKDFIYLNAALPYKPDLVLWMVTLSSFKPSSIAGPTRNISPAAGTDLLAKYGLDKYRGFVAHRQSFMQGTLLGKDKYLKELVLLQLDGLRWHATGIDHKPGRHVPKDKTPMSEDYRGYAPPQLPLDDFTFDVLPAAEKLVGRSKVIVVNEPIRIMSGPGSQVRYNALYPRWAYDQYRSYLDAFASAHQLNYVDAWDAISEAQFYTQLHFSPKAAKHLGAFLTPAILQAACRPPQP